MIRCGILYRLPLKMGDSEVIFAKIRDNILCLRYDIILVRLVVEEE